MIAQRPPVRLTTRVLTGGSLTAAALLGLGLVLQFAGATEIAALVGNVGVVALLLTPAAGLLATWSELRPIRPTHARVALAVLGVLILATLVALLPRV